MLCAQSWIEESMAVKPFVPQSAILGVRRCTPDWRSTRVPSGVLFEYAHCKDSSIRHCTSSALGFMVSEDDFAALFHLIQRQTDFSRFSQLMSDPAGLRRTCRHPAGCCSFGDELCIWICNESLEQILRGHCLGPTEASNTEPSDRTMTAGKRPLQNVISSLDSTKLAGDEICPDRAQMTSMSVWGPNTTTFRCATFNQQGPAFNQQTLKMTTGTMVYRERGIPQTHDGMLPVVSCWHAWRGPGASDLLCTRLFALSPACSASRTSSLVKRTAGNFASNCWNQQHLQQSCRSKKFGCCHCTRTAGSRQAASNTSEEHERASERRLLRQ